MSIYHMTTDPMTGPQATKFLRWFDQNIGTDRERDEVDTGIYVITCMEMTRKEAEKVRNYLS